MKTNDNHVLVTGGSSGIGLALAKKFHKENNHVTITGRNENTLLKVQNEIPGIKVIKSDLSLPDDVEKLAESCKDANILVNNAGIQINKSFLSPDYSIDEISHEFTINLIAPVILIRRMLPSLMLKQNAAIINISSGLALVPKEAAPVYCSSKAGMHLFSKSLRWQLEKSGIRVFEVLPSLVETHMTEGRGKRKISPEKLVQEFWDGFRKDQYEIMIEKVKLLHGINRIFPRLAENIMRKGL